MALIGYGIDLNEYREKDNFPGIVEFVKKYTPDIYHDMLDDVDGNATLKNTLDWLSNFEYNGEEGLHAYLALVLSKEEGIDFESYNDGYGGRYVYLCAEMPWGDDGKVKSLSKDETDEIFRKYILQISEKKYVPDKIYFFDD